ncbi:MAG: D-alanine--D-alanine ligase A [Flavobacteriaceae bacterium]|nr:D-alanine--D-alanine ligase A [Flavobacteriaceae bacterium]|tara:strand:+ start:2893 stop:3912 length:1020 start_codon:yes stop_codon:yes gene_type:complete
MKFKNNDICGMKKQIAVVMGGTTSEHTISIKSGQVVLDNIPDSIFDAKPVVISAQEWTVNHMGNLIALNQSDFSYQYEGKKYIFDAVFIAVHGAPGENGVLQKVLDKAKVPYTGCSAAVSEITYNKHKTLEKLRPHGIAMAKNIIIDSNSNWNSKTLATSIGLPCFVKANKAGSSFGVVKVNKLEEISAAISTALAEDDEVLIESYLSGIEVSIGVIEYKGEVRVLAPTEIITHGDFFDYAAKYEGNSKEITPARLTSFQLQNLNTAARKVFNLLGVKGISRSDFIFMGDTPYFLELNSIPGLTAQSLLPMQAQQSGIALGDLIVDMINSCLKNNTFEE